MSKNANKAIGRSNNDNRRDDLKEFEDVHILNSNTY